jgi:hypothetical protein
VSRERDLRGSVRAAREQAGGGVFRTDYAERGHQMAPTGACSVYWIRANYDRAQRMQPVVSDEKKTGVE